MIDHQRHVSTYGRMVVVASDQFAGRLYRCPCGVKRWTVWGAARRHAETCPQAKS